MSAAVEADGRVRAAADALAALPGTAMSHRTTPSDPFPGVTGRVPEIDVADLTASILGGAIEHHGSLLVRRLLDAACVESLVASIDHAFEAREASLAGAAGEETMPWYAPCLEWDARKGDAAAAARRWARECSAIQVADSPRALDLIIDALAASNLVASVSGYLGERVFLSVNKTTLRRVEPAAVPAWHQDGSFMGAATAAVNIWVALTRCGEGTDAPGIAIVPERVCDIVPVGGTGTLMRSAVGADDLERAAGGAIVSPTFAAGDALLFDQLALHATDGIKREWTRPRCALEAWLFAASSFPHEYVAMAV